MSEAPNPRTILQELGVELPKLDATNAKTGSNTQPNDDGNWPAVKDWKEWADFDYETLRSIFAEVVEGPCPPPLPDRTQQVDPPLPDRTQQVDIMESEIFGEGSVAMHLVRHTMPLLNAALKRANNLLGHEPRDRVHLWDAGRAKEIAGKPDWSLCAENAMSNGRYPNLLPGDTKLSSKWDPTVKPVKSKDKPKWALPVRQVLSYARDLNVRYGFIISDTHLVVLRFRRKKIGASTVLTRRQRTDNHPPSTADGHERVVDAASSNSQEVEGDTDADDDSDDDSDDDKDGSSYSDSDPSTEFANPEYCTIPWTNHNEAVGSKPKSKGAKKPVLTVRLALFYLCLLARYSPNTAIGDDDYPKLHSWTKYAEDSYVHNSSGEKVTERPKDGEIYPAAESHRPASGHNRGLADRTRRTGVRFDTEASGSDTRT